jgi:hypothetical protein
MNDEWKKNIPYVWIVFDETDEQMWIFYDGDTARKFAKERTVTSGNHIIYCDTQEIEDFKKGN